MTFPDLTNLCFSPAARALASYWLELAQKAECLCPSKTDFSPMVLGRFLPFVYLCEWQDDNRLIFRVAGTRIDGHGAVNVTGKNLFDVCPREHAPQMRDHYMNVRRLPCAGVVERPYRNMRGGIQMVKTLQLPLLDQAGEPSLVLGAVHSVPLPAHFADYRDAGLFAAPTLSLNYVDIGTGVPRAQETNAAILPSHLSARYSPAAPMERRIAEKITHETIQDNAPDNEKEKEVR